MKTDPILDTGRLNREKDAGHIPIAALQQGPWIQPDSRDTRMEVRRKLLQESKGKATPWGQMTAGDEVVDYVLDRKLKEENWNHLRFGAYLIDSKKPDSQDFAFSVLPELREYPEYSHAKDLAFQEALRLMIRDGKVGGRDDLALLYEMIKPDFVIPENPLWDPTGIIMEKA